MALLPVDDARARILCAVRPLGDDEVLIDEAIGRASSRRIDVQRTLPPWDTSAMDGFAVRSADAGPRRITATIFAGDRPTASVTAGTCTRIMTGAPVPPGADAVVMQEHTRALGGDLLELAAPPSPGSHIRRRGEDLRAGEVLFEPGRALSLADAGALWSQGLERVHVRRRPIVAIVSSGDELCDVGAPESDRIVDSNSPVIAAAVRRAGGLPRRLGRAADTLESIEGLARQGLDDADVLITIAGASVGEKDFTREALDRLGVEIDFWKVAMKPGKPFGFGRRGSTLVFSLPGNPVSAMVTFELFVRPALRGLQGLAPNPAFLPTARTTLDLHKAPGLRHFIRARYQEIEGALWATPQASQSSGALSSAAGATCLIDLPEAWADTPKGSEVRVLPLDWGG